MSRGRPIKCPYCKSSRTVAKGHRRTMTLGVRPLRKCKSCERRFTYVRKTAKHAIAVAPTIAPARAGIGPE